MSKSQTRRQQRMKTIDDNKTSHLDEEEMKRKLKLEIRLLKLYIPQQMSSDTMCFKDICIPEVSNIAGISRSSSAQLLDIEAKIKNDLYTLAGFCCQKVGDHFIFCLQSSENGLHSNKYWIELYKIQEHWQLGKWVMPLSVDVQVIFAKYNIDSVASMKFFLRECKHSLHCYHHRQYEFMELKAFLLDLGYSRVSLQANYAYTRITLNLVKTVSESSKDVRYFVILFEYKKQEARPYRVIFDCEGEKSLSYAETEALKEVFKKYKEKSLLEVVEKALISGGISFICKQDSQNNSIIDENAEEDSDEETSFLKMLKKNRKPKKKQNKISSTSDENDKEVSEDDDRRENDLSIDAADRSNAQFNEEDVSQADNSKIGKKRSKKAKSPKIKLLKKTKTDLKSEKKTKILQAIGKTSLLLQNRNDDACNTDQNDGKRKKTIVPEIFKPNAKQTKGFLEDINAMDTQLQKLAKKKSKVVNSGKKTLLSGKNSTITPTNRSRVELTCSTPIVVRPTNLSTVAKENISAIGKKNMIMMTEITGIDKIQDTSARSDSDGSNSDDSDCKDVTKTENTQRELLKDLQAVKDNVTVTKKPSKLKGKYLAGGKNKVARYF